MTASAWDRLRHIARTATCGAETTGPHICRQPAGHRHPHRCFVCHYEWDDR